LGIEMKSEDLAELVDPEAEVEQVATGFTFTEGPVWNQAGDFLLFSDMPGDVRRRWSEKGGRDRAAPPQQQGQRHGL
jgi:gluconolactonase